MNFLKTAFSAAAFLVSLAIPQFAFAQSTLYSTRADWQAAAGNPINIDFSTLDSGEPITNPIADAYFESLSLRGVTFQQIRSYANLYIGAAAQTAPARAVLPANTLALAADLGAYYEEPGILTVTLSTGEIFTFSIDGGSSRVFFGVTSATPIQWMEVTHSWDLSAMDNFSYVAPPAVQTVGIDIIPGSSTNLIRVNSNNEIPVAILSTSTFDAANVNASSVRFGRTGTEAAALKYTLKDVNKDGRRDMILTFNTRHTGIKDGDTVAHLTGKLTSGQNIKGSDSILTRP